jgi:murein L,D-transpeptidase YcbB/YkuD
VSKLIEPTEQDITDLLNAMMTDDELDNKPVSDAEFAEFMRIPPDTHEVEVNKVQFSLPLTQDELDDLLAEVCGNPKENPMNFDTAFTILMKHEGGYSNHADDTGGATMWGVTEAVARANGYTGEMRKLPQEFARKVYRAAYWDAVRADELPEAVRYSVFDAAVNSGVKRAVRWLQEAVGTNADGVIGPKTLAAVRQQVPDALNAKYNGVRLQFMTDLSNWSSFGKGWARRIASNLQGA